MSVAENMLLIASQLYAGPFQNLFFDGSTLLMLQSASVTQVQAATGN